MSDEGTGPSDQEGRWEPGTWQPPAPPPQYGYGPPPQYGYAAPQPQTEGTAITVLVLAIASFVVCPVIPAVVALALCPSAQRRIESSGGMLTGEGLVTAARIVSWINIGLYGLFAVGFVIFFAVVAATGGFDDPNELSLVLSLLR